jgi:mercuric ion transport protein
LLLVSLGIGGAWMSALTSMETVRPYFIILTLIFIGLGYRKLYWAPASCEEGKASATAPASMPSCASPEVKHKQRRVFWISSTVILLLLAFPWIAPFFME